MAAMASDFLLAFAVALSQQRSGAFHFNFCIRGCIHAWPRLSSHAQSEVPTSTRMCMCACGPSFSCTRYFLTLRMHFDTALQSCCTATHFKLQTLNPRIHVQTYDTSTA